MRDYQTYDEFWPHYLREHAKPTTRAWHYFGTTLAILLLAYSLFTQKWVLLLIVPVCGYFFAWLSHAFVERNRPATFTYPLWSLISDFKMLGCFVTGKMGRELEKAGVSAQPEQS